ncbi:hypothetical protein E4T56_gene20384 [Termitomyces sp. T112]|nr:hypothetical protein E4T56_gene20384 [Termitomyces sp. T112]
MLFSAYSPVLSALSLASPDSLSSGESESPHGYWRVKAMYQSLVAGLLEFLSCGRVPVERGPGYAGSVVGSPGGGNPRKVEALCALCACHGDHCNFEELVLGSQWDTLAACISEEQEWDMEWVAMQLLEGHKGKVLCQESRVECGDSMGWLIKEKWRASPSPEVGPSKQLQGEELMAGPMGPHIYSPVSEALMKESSGGPILSPIISKTFWQQQAEALSWLLASYEEEVQRIMEDRNGIHQEHNKVWRGQDSGLQEQLVQSEVWVEQRAEVGQGAAEAERARAEVSRQQEEWLANEVALRQRGIMCESSCLCSYDLADPELSRLGWIGMDAWGADVKVGAGVLADGVVVGRTLADPGAWWEVAANVGEPLSGQLEVLAIVVAQMEVDLVGGVVWRISEEERE